MSIRLNIAAFVVLTSAGVGMSGHPAQTQDAACLVTTGLGPVQGTALESSCTFLGIPFAAPPIGDLRWKPPQSAAAWTSTFNATTSSPPCPAVFPPGGMTTQGNENCLRLNVWTPNPMPAAPAPVIVWIPPGAFVAASANLAAHNGRRLAETTGAIVVSANYRLGPFGFLGHPALTAEDPDYPSSGNYGFLDQRAALAWVRDHIAAFGGDPNNITIGGQSAGGHSVSLHLVSPGSAGYFQRAVMISGYASSRWRSLTDAERLGSDTAAALGCTDPSQVLSCLRGKTTREILLALPTGQQEFAEGPRAPWGPVVDYFDIPDQPRTLYANGTFNRVPIIIGATRDEGWTYVDRSFPAGLTTTEYEAAVETEFGPVQASAILAMYPASDFASPKAALSQLTGDFEAVCEVRRIARLVERTRTPVYVYSFEHEVDAVSGDQVIHGLDTSFWFGNNYGPPSNYVLGPDDRALSNALAGYLTRFAAGGNPNIDDESVVHWPGFTHPAGLGRGPAQHIVLDWPVSTDKRLREVQCDYWETLFLGSINGAVPAWRQ